MVDATTFGTYCAQLHQRSSLREEKENLTAKLSGLQQAVTYLSLHEVSLDKHPRLTSVCQEAVAVRQKIKSIVRCHICSATQDLQFVTIL